MENSVNKINNDNDNDNGNGKTGRDRDVLSYPEIKSTVHDH